MTASAGKKRNPRNPSPCRPPDNRIGGPALDPATVIVSLLILVALKLLWDGLNELVDASYRRALGGLSRKMQNAIAAKA